MDHFDRREFLRGSSVAAAAASLAWPADLMAAKAAPSSGSSGGWDPGSVQHLLPTVRYDRILIKASFRTPLLEAPILRIGGTSVRGRMTDTHDEATDEIITFPPPYFSLQLARATQSLFYPEYLPDVARPLGLPWSSVGDRSGGVSETFGTIRYGRLAEILLYDIRRTQTLAGQSAVYVELEVERWLKARSAARDVTHVVHVPSNPPGWTD